MNLAHTNKQLSAMPLGFDFGPQISNAMVNSSVISQALWSSHSVTHTLVCCASGSEVELLTVNPMFNDTV